jgi:hypothetical protein
MRKTSTSEPDELQVIRVLLEQLTPLDEAARRRVVGYAFEKLGISWEGDAKTQTSGPRGNRPEVESPIKQSSVSGQGSGYVKDLRTLVAEKQPASAMEMAVLVAYYLKEIAPEAEKKAAIAVADIERYFKQGGYPLPKVIRFVLTNAKEGGYFDSSARGQYALTTVGYNLAAHKMPTRAQKKI